MGHELNTVNVQCVDVLTNVKVVGWLHDPQVVIVSAPMMLV